MILCMILCMRHMRQKRVHQTWWWWWGWRRRWRWWWGGRKDKWRRCSHDWIGRRKNKRRGIFSFSSPSLVWWWSNTNKKTSGGNNRSFFISRDFLSRIITNNWDKTSKLMASQRMNKRMRIHTIFFTTTSWTWTESSCFASLYGSSSCSRFYANGWCLLPLEPSQRGYQAKRKKKIVLVLSRVWDRKLLTQTHTTLTSCFLSCRVATALLPLLSCFFRAEASSFWRRSIPFEEMIPHNMHHTFQEESQ